MKTSFDDDFENQLAEYRTRYGKHPVVSYECRLDPVSKLLETGFSENLTPLIERPMPVVSLNAWTRILELIRNRESGIEYLYEALIKTFPPEKFISEYSRLCRREFGGAVSSIRTSALARPDELNVISEFLIDSAFVKDYLVVLHFPYLKNIETRPAEDLLRKIVDGLFVCGYNLALCQKLPPSQVNPSISNDVQIYRLQFEGNHVGDEIKLNDELYHITSALYIEKIRKYGLCPRSCSDKFQYPPRIYLFNGPPTWMLNFYGMQKLAQLEKKYRGLNIANLNRLVVLKLKRKKLVESQLFKTGKIVFYKDVCFGNSDESCPAIFTYGNIPSNLIEDDCLVCEKTGSGFKSQIWKFK